MGARRESVRKVSDGGREATNNISVRKAMLVKLESTWETMGTFGPVLLKVVSF